VWVIVLILCYGGDCLGFVFGIISVVFDCRLVLYCLFVMVGWLMVVCGLGFVFGLVGVVVVCIGLSDVGVFDWLFFGVLIVCDSFKYSYVKWI